MSDILKNSSGQIIGVLPTLYQGDHERERNRDAYYNAQADKARAALAKKAARARKNQPTEVERMAAIVEGLRRFSKKAKRNGDDEVAAALDAHADEAQKGLAEYEKLSKKLTSKRPDPLGDAQKAAAVELSKILPTCFPSERDAFLFACRLPLVDATAEAGRKADDFAKTARARTKAGRRFWDAVEAGGKLAIAGPDTDSNTRQLAAAGLL